MSIVPAMTSKAKNLAQVLRDQKQPARKRKMATDCVIENWTKFIPHVELKNYKSQTTDINEALRAWLELLQT